jgi:hypothetical protein
MVFADDCECPFGDSVDIVESLDNIYFPRRPAQVQSTGVNPCHENAQLPPVAGFRERDVSNMKLEIKLIVIDPIGIVDTEGQRNQLLPKNGRRMEPALDVPENVLVSDDAFGRRRLIVDIQRGKVQVCTTAFKVKKCGVLCA